MKYMGSKNRIAKFILPIVLKDRTNESYIEPFVGGGNIISKVKGKRIGYDISEDCISALLLIRDKVNKIPKNNKEFTENDYKNRCLNEPHLKGFASFAYSYGANIGGGWRRDSSGKRDYIAESYRNALKQSESIQGVDLYCMDYRKIVLKKKSIIYCDPPYMNTTKYKDGFGHDFFFNWCREVKSKGHKIFISEYSAPSDFVCVWEKEINSSLTKNTGAKKGIEKLFTLR